MKDIVVEVIKLITEIGALFTISLAIWKALYEYRLKIQADTLNAKKVEAELEIALIKHFTELIDIANGRGKSELSNVAIEKCFSENIITDADKADLKSLKIKLDYVALFTMPVGAAAQNAAIASIGVLGLSHNILKHPAVQFLAEIKNSVPVAEKYYQQIMGQNAQLTQGLSNIP